MHCGNTVQYRVYEICLLNIKQTTLTIIVERNRTKFHFIIHLKDKSQPTMIILLSQLLDQCKQSYRVVKVSQGELAVIVIGRSVQCGITFHFSYYNALMFLPRDNSCCSVHQVIAQCSVISRQEKMTLIYIIRAALEITTPLYKGNQHSMSIKMVYNIKLCPFSLLTMRRSYCFSSLI